MPTGMPPISTVTVVGTGVIGRSWAQVLARAGCATRLHDRDPAQVEKALALFAADLEQDVAEGFETAAAARACLERVSAHVELGAALSGSGYVQESGPEDLAKKRAIYAELDRLADPAAILASSTSAMDMTEIAAGLAGAARCIVAHPVNPPHVVPVVEVLPGKATDPDIVSRTITFLRAVGQTPVLMQRYAPGFLLNRMQAALVREAIHLVESGVADVDAVDAVIRDGLGLRWALMGPFGVGNTNADGGLREYFARYGKAYIELMNDLGPTPTFTPEQIERWGRATDAMTGGAPRDRLRAWRDRLVRKIRRLKQDDPAG
jgi:3-hydroxyacyl-CoA dehydrogenase